MDKYKSLDKYRTRYHPYVMPVGLSASQSHRSHGYGWNVGSIESTITNDIHYYNGSNYQIMSSKPSNYETGVTPVTVIAIDRSGSVCSAQPSIDGSIAPDDGLLGHPSAYDLSCVHVVEEYLNKLNNIPHYLIGMRWGSDPADLVIHFDLFTGDTHQKAVKFVAWTRERDKLGTSPRTIIDALPDRHIGNLIIITDGQIDGSVDVTNEVTHYSGELGDCAKKLVERELMGCKIENLVVYVFVTGMMNNVSPNITGAFSRSVAHVTIFSKERNSYDCPIIEGFHASMHDVEQDLVQIATQDPSRLVEASQNYALSSMAHNQFGTNLDVLDKAISQASSMEEYAKQLRDKQIEETDEIRKIHRNIHLSAEDKRKATHELCDKWMQYNSCVAEMVSRSAILLSQSSAISSGGEYEQMSQFCQEISNVQYTTFNGSPFQYILPDIYGNGSCASYSVSHAFMLSNDPVSFEQSILNLIITMGDGKPILQDINIQSPLDILKNPELVQAIMKRFDSPTGLSMKTLMELHQRNDMISPLTRNPILGCIYFGKNTQLSKISSHTIGRLLFGENNGQTKLYGNINLWILTIYCIACQSPMFQNNFTCGIIRAFDEYIRRIFYEESNQVEITLTTDQNFKPRLFANLDVALYYCVFMNRLGKPTILNGLSSNIISILENIVQNLFHYVI